MNQIFAPRVAARVYGLAAVFLLAGLSIQRRRSGALGTLTLTILYSLGVILLHVPLVIASDGWRT